MFRFFTTECFFSIFSAPSEIKFFLFLRVSQIRYIIARIIDIYIYISLLTKARLSIIKISSRNLTQTRAVPTA